jgi:hypothetical protein
MNGNAYQELWQKMEWIPCFGKARATAGVKVQQYKIQIQNIYR